MFPEFDRQAVLDLALTIADICREHRRLEAENFELRRRVQEADERLYNDVKFFQNQSFNIVKALVEKADRERNPKETPAEAVLS